MFIEVLGTKLTILLHYYNQSQQQSYKAEVIISISWKRKYKWFAHGQTTRNFKLILVTFIYSAFYGTVD